MATKSNPAQAARQREWLEHLEACRAQGLSVKAYAEQAGLEVRRLYQWRRRLRARGVLADEGKVVRFARVEVCAAGGVSASRRLHFPNGLILDWEGNVELELIEQLLRLAPVGR